MNDQTLKATEWHKKPPNFVGPCPICGLARKEHCNHRAVAPDEQMKARWIIRRKSKGGWRYFPVTTTGKRVHKRRLPIKKSEPEPTVVTSKVPVAEEEARTGFKVGARSRLAKYLRAYVQARPDLRASSIQQLSMVVRQFDVWHGKPLSLENLRAELVIRFMSDCLRHGLAAVTVNSKRRAIMTLWRAAAEDELVPPPKKVPRLKEPLRIPEAWTLEEVERLLARCQDLTGTVGDVLRRDWWTALLLTVFDTGGRIGAVRAAKSADYDRSGHLLLRAENQKTHRDDLAALTRQTVEAIDHLHDPARDLLFPWPYSYIYLWRYFRRHIVLKAGVRYSPRQGMNLFHRLRRTSGSLVEANGGDGARHLGHSRQVFEKRYRDPRICGSGQVDLLPRPRVQQPEAFKDNGR